ncbi:alcohol dehydrogenase catalytic domain-containing protein [Streptomyces sp. NPDC005708]|uniref:alcohol dehydrogenase catalytic domain-containing protein n=1 Tax=Streptomyces sp. NPDC005708 TaxID=3154564 RepID=UPI003402DAB4
MIVTEIGADVTRYQVGDRVGVGCMVNSCGKCAHYRNGDEQYCLSSLVPTYGGVDRDDTTQGRYSTPRRDGRRLRSVRTRQRSLRTASRRSIPRGS